MKIDINRAYHAKDDTNVNSRDSPRANRTIKTDADTLNIGKDDITFRRLRQTQKRKSEKSKLAVEVIKFDF
jgi:hypothetical protein